MIKNRIIPVTTADRSPMVCSFLTMRLNTNSESTEVATQTETTTSERNPKRMHPATSAGMRAIMTSSIIFFVLVLLWK